MGRRWGRKRKNDGSVGGNNKKAKTNGRAQGNKNYSGDWQINRRLEAYYALQGLHDVYLDEESGKFIHCETDAQKETERKKWMGALRRILMASFRIGTDVDQVVRERLEKELDELVGKEMELKLDPRGGLRVENEDNNHLAESKREQQQQQQDPAKPKQGQMQVRMNLQASQPEVSTESITDAKKDENKDRSDEAETIDGEVPAAQTNANAAIPQQEVEELEQGTLTRIAPAQKIPFIPYAYQLSVDRRTIRRNPALNKFHEWLKVQTEAGFVTRQETVSMIPPIVLDVHPHHQVLDMCAAPGSKTSQLLEIVSQPVQEDDREPRGCVVANDSDPKRAYMLVHQLRRINSPVAFVTSCDAQFFPLLKDGAKHEEGMFDRVLADVPCSGDGTFRKNPGVWKSWSSLNSLALHPLQVAIALNAARLTKVGGYLCYSTCSMSPIENEAVVAELLRKTEGSLELVDRREAMPGLKARHGWSTWKVVREEKSKREAKNQKKKNSPKMQERRKQWDEHKKRVWEEEGGQEREAKLVDDVPEVRRKCELGTPPSWDDDALEARAKAEGLVVYKSYDEVEEKWKRKVRKSCFPPMKEEASHMSLAKCLRCLPHDMDTGGFFVALLKKVKPLGKKAREESEKLAHELRSDIADAEGTEIEAFTKVGSDKPVNESQTNAKAKADPEAKNKGKIVKDKALLRGKGKTRGDLGNENFSPSNADLWDPLIEFYGLSDDFPRERYMTRSAGDSKVMYFVGKPVKDFIDRGIQDRITVINSGLKGFERNAHQCEVRYRVAQEGIQFLAPYMSKRKLIINLETFRKCLQPGPTSLDTFAEPFKTRMCDFSVGSFVVILEGFENNYTKKMILVMWRCRSEAVNCLVCKTEMDGMESKLRAITGEEDPGLKVQNNMS